MTRKRLEELLGRLEPAMAKRYRQVMQRVRSKRTLAQLEAALEGGAGPLVGAILDDIDAATAVLASRAAAAHTLVAQEVAAALSTVLDELVDYDATNVRAVNALTRSRYALISHINEEQRQAIGEALRIGSTNGWNPRKTAVLIRDSIGLTPHQTGIVANYRRSLEQLDRKALTYKLRDLRSDKAVASAIERGVEISPKQIDKMVGRYADRQLALRAETIARTETLRAIHEGQDEGYQQAIDAGKLEQSRLQCRWHAGTAPRTRNWHASMNGQKRRHGVPFRSGQGNELRYPCESGAPASEVINCRCGKSVRVLPVGQVAIDSDGADAQTAFNRGDRKVVVGLPAHSDLTSKTEDRNVYDVSIDDLRGRVVAIGQVTDEKRVQRIRDAWANGKKLDPVRVVMDPSGQMLVEDGRHRLTVAAEQGRRVLVRVDRGDTGGASPFYLPPASTTAP